MINPPGALDAIDEIVADVCIVGSGPAGITLALELRGTDLRVALLESGSFEYEPDSQELAAGRNIGHPYADLDTVRLRMFGGTSGHWNGQCAPLSRAAMAGRPGWPGSRWPIEHDELADPYRRAQEVCQLGDMSLYDLELSRLGRVDPSRRRTLNAIAEGLSWRVFQQSPPTRFGETYRQPLETAANIQVYLGATLVSLSESDDGSRIVDADIIGTFSGKKVRVRANTFVVAAGGIENARILLKNLKKTRDERHKGRRLIGRYFMEHLYVGEVARAVVGAPRDAWRPFVWHSHGDARIKADLTLPDRFFEERNIPAFDFRISQEESLERFGANSLRYLFREARKISIPDNFDLHVRNVIKNHKEIIPLLKRKLGRPGHVDLSLSASFEQEPNINSRVLLDEERDRFGQNRVALDWRVGTQSPQFLRRVLLETGKRFLEHRIGAVQVLIGRERDFDENLEWQWHHMGTTRMSEDPGEGVVTPECRVHGVENLYVAGSSVFPSGGTVNPTLTICALAVRLAGHLRSRMRG